MIYVVCELTYNSKPLILHLSACSENVIFKHEPKTGV